MSRPTLARSLARRIRRLARDRRGVEAVEFALIAPILVIVTVGVLELGLMVFDYHRAGEATRRGVRTAIINPPIASMSDLKSGTINCAGAADDSITCGASEMFGEASFPLIVQDMQGILPTIGSENIDVSYAPSGIASDDTPGMVTPLVTVTLVGYEHEFALLDIIPGIPASVTFPPFSTTQVAPAAAIPIED
ncbi:MAG: pilus assembly protein [Alphaproteobacteria bacterium]|nr:pilus assembly protein [Alphaproteobacteria bacterium]